MPRPSTKTKFAKRSPVKDKADTADRQKRLGLDIFVYNCHACGKERAHSSGYMFVVMFGLEWLYFCNVDCCDHWEKSNPEMKISEPVTDRRGAILATRKKNEKDDPRT
jgi:hypothetical protein